MSQYKIYTITDARKNIFNIVEDVHSQRDFVQLTERGRPKVVMMPAEEFESWKETLEVLQEFPQIEKDITKAKEDFSSGQTISLEEVLAQGGYIVAPHNKDYVSSRAQQKGKKGHNKSRRKR